MQIRKLRRRFCSNFAEHNSHRWRQALEVFVLLRVIVVQNARQRGTATAVCVDRGDGWIRQLHSRRVHRPEGLAGYQSGNAALFLVVCDDPMH